MMRHQAMLLIIQQNQFAVDNEMGSQSPAKGTSNNNVAVGRRILPEAWVNFPTIHSNNHIAQGIRIKFAVGAYFDSEGQRRKEIDDFARNHLYGSMAGIGLCVYNLPTQIH